jgi:sialidase-1
MNEQPLDNEYAWKGNPYRLDGWLKPTVTVMQFACDDPQVAWFCDSAGRAYFTRDRGQTWRNVSNGMMGASVTNLVASKTRTFVVWAKTNKGTLLSHDGGLSWRDAGEKDLPEFIEPKFGEWLTVADGTQLRVNEEGELVHSTDGGKTSRPAMEDWRIPRSSSLFQTPWGIIASGPGGAYRSDDGHNWNELSLWREQETGPADYLHAYWMGRYYGFIAADGEDSKGSAVEPEGAKGATIELTPALRSRCVEILRGGLRADQFWPSMHASEALTFAGYGKCVQLWNGSARRPTIGNVAASPASWCGPAIGRHVATCSKCLESKRLRTCPCRREPVQDRAYRRRQAHARARATSSKAPLKLMGAAALVRCGAPAAINVVRHSLANGDPEAKRIAAWLISQIGDSSDAMQLETNIKNEQDPVKRAYAENGLAVLGGDKHRMLLTRNLAHPSDEIRGLAAMAAIDGRHRSRGPTLENARRSNPRRTSASRARVDVVAAGRTSEAITVDVYPATDANPRYSEGSILVLSDGSLLATTEFIGSESDFAKAHIIARTSRDGGKTWSEPRVLQENVGRRT